LSLGKILTIFGSLGGKIVTIENLRRYYQFDGNLKGVCGLFFFFFFFFLMILGETRATFNPHPLNPSLHMGHMRQMISTN
jgi:hypothetical protein